MKKPAWIAAAAAAVWLPVAWSALSPEDERITAPTSPEPAPTVIAPPAAKVPVAAVARPAPVITPPRPAPAATPVVDEDDLAENEAIEAEINTSEQRAWRGAWASEQHDERWTQQVAREIKKRGETVLRGDLKLHDLSCRQTVCRLFLQFSDREDAQAFMRDPTQPSLHYEYQRLDPQFEGPDQPQSALEYELMIVQKDGVPAAPVASTDGEEPIELPGEDELITIVAKKPAEL